LRIIICGVYAHRAFSGWGTGKYGKLHDLLFNQECPNPIILLDEVEKSPKDGNAPFANVLYGLLEQNNARHFRDEFVEVSMDASLINWFATCNQVERLDAPIRDRFEILTVRAPSSDEMKVIIPNMYKGLIQDKKLNHVFSGCMTNKVVDKLALMAGSSLRQVKLALDTALSTAAQRYVQNANGGRSLRLRLADLPDIKPEYEASPIGFIWG